MKRESLAEFSCKFWCEPEGTGAVLGAVAVRGQRGAVGGGAARGGRGSAGLERFASGDEANKQEPQVVR